MLTEVDADLLLQDFGSSVIAGAVSGLGILDRKGDVIIDGQIVTVDHSLIARMDQFGNLQYGDIVRVDGETYKVHHEPIRIADGVYGVVLIEPFTADGLVGTGITTITGDYLVTQDGRFIITL